MNPPSESIIVYATEWCYDCRRARRFFDKHKIAYAWINIDHDPAGEQRVISLNQGNRSVPTIIFPDGSFMVEPSEAELRQKLVPESA